MKLFCWSCDSSLHRMGGRYTARCNPRKHIAGSCDECLKSRDLWNVYRDRCAGNEAIQPGHLRCDSGNRTQLHILLHSTSFEDLKWNYDYSCRCSICIHRRIAFPSTGRRDDRINSSTMIRCKSNSQQRIVFR